MFSIARSIRSLCFYARRARGGMAAVEFGLFAPVILLMMLGLIDFSMYIATRIELEQAVRAGAQYALRNPAGVTNITNSVIAATSDLTLAVTDVTVGAPVCECLDSGASNLCPDDLSYTPCPGDGSQPAEYVSVSASTIYDPMFLDLPTLTSNMTVTQDLTLRVR